MRRGLPLVAALLLVGAAPSTASAAKPAAALHVVTVANPSTFFPFTGSHRAECEHEGFVGGGHDCDKYYVLVENTGSVATEEPITITIQLPEHVTIVPGGMQAEPEGSSTCEEPAAGQARCTIEGALVPGGYVRMRTAVEVAPEAATPVRSVVTVEGGGVEPPPAPQEVTTPVGETPTTSGIEQFSATSTGPAGEEDNQAGAHPNLFTTTLAVPNVITEYSEPTPLESIKNLQFYLPLGFVGNAEVAPRCPASLVEGSGGLSACPPSTQVGDMIPSGIGGINLEDAPEDPAHAYGVYNVQPEAGTPAEFAFKDSSQQIFIYTAVVRRHGEYVVRVDVPGVPRVSKLFFLTASFFGDLVEQYGVETIKKRDIGAFLTNPSDCGAGALESEVELTTWAHPERVLSASSTSYKSIVGCAALAFAPTLKVAPDTTSVDAPSGYTFGLDLPQAANFGSNLATPPVKNVTLTLPEGVSISPAAAQGLGACQPTGSEGIDLEGPGSEETGPEGLARMAPGHCAASSEVATVSATVPIIQEGLQGHLYLAAPKCGGPAQPQCEAKDAENGNLFSGYLELENPNLGIVVKLAGTLDVNATTGRITARFENNPQFPVSRLTVHTTGGPRAVLANPQSCGTASTLGAIEPWSAPITPSVTPTSSFPVIGCGSSMGFAPIFTAGTVSANAGSYSPLTLTLSRQDSEQDLQDLTTTLPAGLLARLAGVPRCEEAQANAGACPQASEIGTVTVAAGAGSSPYPVQGHIYLTGPYNNGPFGEVVEVPAVAGPFNLGTVVVRGSIRVNPTTAQATIVSNPFPTILDGVPLRVKTVNVTVNRPGFTFNPTACTQQQLTGTVTAQQGASANVASSFAATGCKNLPFKPSFTASAAGRASKAGGASLVVKVGSKGGPGVSGEEANIRSVKVDLPKHLPSRLTTLQKACTAAQFEANPAGCPKESDVGTAIAHTPVLAVPLTGPAYLVSHGDEAFPDLEIVLQGEGVTLILDGNTLIKKGITSSTFRTVPDAPISSFELKLPTGKFSILGTDLPQSAHYSLCGQTLKMPTAITGQNGVEIHQTTRIGVSGCSKAHKAKKKRTTKSDEKRPRRAKKKT